MDDSHSTSAQRVPAAVTRVSLGRRPGKILLVDGNRLNQKIAARILQTDSHEVTTVTTGKQLLAALGESTFDLVLMDAEMSDATGCEAAGIVREIEAASGGHLPIVAMTSSTMEGYQCLQAGMDQFIARPLSLDQLRSVIASYLPPVDPEPVFDQTAALLRVNGDQAFLCILASMFVEESPSQIVEIRAAVEQQNGERLSRAAHKLKGSVSPFFAATVTEAAQALESIGESGQLANAMDAYHRFETENRRLLTALTALLARADGQGSRNTSIIGRPEESIPCTL